MKDVTVEDLKAKFVVAKVAPYGEVIMVPGGDFDPDWEALLEDLGFGCVFTEINGEKFTLVRLEKEEGEEERVTRRAGAQPGQKMIHWSDADEERLLKRIQELPGFIEEIVERLVQEFPGRSAMALQKKYEKLTRGKKSRKARSGKTLTKKLLAERGSERPKEKSIGTYVPTAIPKGDLEDLPRAERVATAGAQLDVVKTLAGLEDKVKALHQAMKFHNGIIVRLHCAVVMQALEAQERRGVLTIPPALRNHYVRAITATSNEMTIAGAFFEKAGLLVEASS